MATRFIALLSQKSERLTGLVSHIAQHSDLQLRFNSAGLAVFLDAAGASVAFPDGTGLLIGSAFTSEHPPARLRANNSSSILRGIGLQESLISSIWGGYVAVAANEGAGAVWGLRDPSGTIPCFLVEIADVTILVSDIESLYEVDLLTPTINWANVVYGLLALENHAPETSLNGVVELLPGHGVTIGQSGRTIRSFWSPWSHTSETGQTFDAAAKTLRETIDSTVKAWASQYSHVLLAVSGGLDSSILATALKGSGASFSCMTMATEESEGDERVFARALADYLKFDLYERRQDVSAVDYERSMSAHLPRPIGFGHSQSHDVERQRLTASLKADAYFTGQGGDNIFCYMHSATPLLDRFNARGLGLGCWQTLNDICALTGCTYWEAIHMAAERARRKSRSYAVPIDSYLLSADLVATSAPSAVHPWLDSQPEDVAGKSVHVAMLVRILTSLQDISRKQAGPLSTPLLLQPVVEACLRIPTWQWIAGGRDRSVAREAYKDGLPDLVKFRRTKGGPNSFCIEAINTNRARLREHLLGGILASERIVDRGALERIFLADAPIDTPDHIRLSVLAEAESWLRVWTQRGKDARPKALHHAGKNP